MKWIRSILMAALAATTMTAVATSQEQVPHEMFDYLKPGMYVGMERLNGTASVALNVYSDGQDGRLAVARSLSGAGPRGVDADEFAKSHPAVRNQLAELKKQPAAEKLQLRIRGALDITIGRITGIGTDHLVIELDDRSKLRLLPKAAIKYIDLDAEPATFIFAPADTTDQNDIGSKSADNPFSKKIVLIYGDGDGSTLHFENARVESVFGRQMFVGEQVTVNDDPTNPSYTATGVVHFFPFERVGGCIAIPTDFMGKRLNLPSKSKNQRITN